MEPSLSPEAADSVKSVQCTGVIRGESKGFLELLSRLGFPPDFQQRVRQGVPHVRVVGLQLDSAREVREGFGRAAMHREGEAPFEFGVG